MNYKCINKKVEFLNLTVNKNYDGIEEGDRIIITADNGTRQKYASKYFRRALQTLEEILDAHLSLRLQGGARLTVAWSGETPRSLDIDITPSRISCGVHELSGISQIETLIDEIITEFGSDAITVDAVSRTIWQRIIAHLRRNTTNLVFVICSTDVGVEYDPYWACLEEICEVYHEGINNNSGNTISIWIIRIHE
jgi:hypothetical protein